MKDDKFQTGFEKTQEFLIKTKNGKLFRAGIMHVDRKIYSPLFCNTPVESEHQDNYFFATLPGRSEDGVNPQFAELIDVVKAEISQSDDEIEEIIICHGVRFIKKEYVESFFGGGVIVTYGNVIFDCNSFPQIKSACEQKKDIVFDIATEHTNFENGKTPDEWVDIAPAALTGYDYVMVYTYAEDNARGAMSKLELYVSLSGGNISYKGKDTGYVSVRVTWPQ